VHKQDHAAVDPGIADRLVDIDQGQHGGVGAGALHRRVDAQRALQLHLRWRHLVFVGIFIRLSIVQEDIE